MRSIGRRRRHVRAVGHVWVHIARAPLPLRDQLGRMTFSRRFYGMGESSGVSRRPSICDSRWTSTFQAHVMCVFPVMPSMGVGASGDVGSGHADQVGALFALAKA